MILIDCPGCHRKRCRFFTKGLRLSRKALSDAIGKRADHLEETEGDSVDLLICSRCYRQFAKYLEMLSSLAIANNYGSPSNAMHDYTHEDAASAAFFALVESSSPGHDVAVRRSLGKPNEVDEFVIGYKGVHSWWCVRTGENAFVSHRWYM
jgi:hypothetical protein